MSIKDKFPESDKPHHPTHQSPPLQIPAAEEDDKKRQPGMPHEGKPYTGKPHQGKPGTGKAK